MPINRVDFGDDFQAKMEYLKNYEKELANQALSQQDFEDAIKNVRPSVPPGTLQKYFDWSEAQGSD